MFSAQQFTHNLFVVDSSVLSVCRQRRLGRAAVHILHSLQRPLRVSDQRSRARDFSLPHWLSLPNPEGLRPGGQAGLP
nr:hypothetical protein Iba_scaffold18821CG0030 [Ipomoea batatas]